MSGDAQRGHFERVTVCSACGTAACWNGVLMCEDARGAESREVESDPLPSTLRDGRPHPTDTPAVQQETVGALVGLSRWIDEHNVRRDPEAVLWGRVSKIGEEFGEVIQSLIGYTGQNPRKGFTHSRDDVQEELLDVAVTALCAIEHLRGHDGRALAELDDKIRRVHLRAIGWPPGGAR